MEKTSYEIVPEHRCGGCGNYRRHYVLVRHPRCRHFMPLEYGHCVYPRLKKRAPDQSCAYWKADGPR